MTLEGTSFEDEDFTDIARHGIVEVVGDDAAGRKIIVISACKYASNDVYYDVFNLIFNSFLIGLTT
jgi:hypothetical protein